MLFGSALKRQLPTREQALPGRATRAYDVPPTHAVLGTSMVGPWPEEAELYHQRSPIYHLDGFSCPVILFQGAEDVIVPPAQIDQLLPPEIHLGRFGPEHLLAAVVGFYFGSRS